MSDNDAYDTFLGPEDSDDPSGLGREEGKNSLAGNLTAADSPRGSLDDEIHGTEETPSLRLQESGSPAVSPPRKRVRSPGTAESESVNRRISGNSPKKSRTRKPKFARSFFRLDPLSGSKYVCCLPVDFVPSVDSTARFLADPFVMPPVGSVDSVDLTSVCGAAFSVDKTGSTGNLTRHLATQHHVTRTVFAEALAVLGLGPEPSEERNKGNSATGVDVTETTTSRTAPQRISADSRSEKRNSGSKRGSMRPETGEIGGSLRIPGLQSEKMLAGLFRQLQGKSEVHQRHSELLQPFLTAMEAELSHIFLFLDSLGSREVPTVYYKHLKTAAATTLFSRLRHELGDFYAHLGAQQENRELCRCVWRELAGQWHSVVRKSFLARFLLDFYYWAAHVVSGSRARPQNGSSAQRVQTWGTKLSVAAPEELIAELGFSEVSVAGSVPFAAELPDYVSALLDFADELTEILESIVINVSELQPTAVSSLEERKNFSVVVLAGNFLTTLLDGLSGIEKVKMSTEMRNMLLGTSPEGLNASGTGLEQELPVFEYIGKRFGSRLSQLKRKVGKIDEIGYSLALRGLMKPGIM